MAKLALLIFLLFFGCVPQKNAKVPSEQVDINIIVYARSTHDASKRMAKFLKATKEKMPKGIRIKHIKIRYYDQNYPNIISNNFDYEKLKRFKTEKDSLNIFFVHKIFYKDRDDVRGISLIRVNDICNQIIVLTDNAVDTTLVHEIGHFFGLEHMIRVDNIMFGGRNEKISSFTNQQEEIMLKNAIKFKSKCS